MSGVWFESALRIPPLHARGAGKLHGSSLRHSARNLYTFEDHITLARGRHQLEFGAWLQRFQSNETIALSQFGQATFTSLQTFLQGTISSFLFDPSPTEMNWRSLFSAWYAQDTIRITPRFTLTLGFRDEFSTGWNEAHGRAANYFFTNGVINSTPHVGDSLSRTTTPSFCRSRVSALPGVPLALRPLSAQASACTTICRMPWGIAPIRTFPSIPPTASPQRSRSCPLIRHLQ